MALVTFYDEETLSYLKNTLHVGDCLLYMMENGITIDLTDVISDANKLQYGFYTILNTFYTIDEDQRIWEVYDEVKHKYLYVYVTAEYDCLYSYNRKDFKNNKYIFVIRKGKNCE